MFHSSFFHILMLHLKLLKLTSSFFEGLNERHGKSPRNCLSLFIVMLSEFVLSSCKSF